MTKSNDQENEILSAWQSESSEQVLISEGDIQDQLNVFHRKIRIRNTIEYFAGFVVLAVFTVYAVYFESLFMKIGSILAIVGTVFVMVNMHSRAGRRSQPISFESRSFYIAEMERQRDALNSVWLWYILPLVPGYIVFRIGMHLSDMQSNPFLYDVASILVVAFVIWLNRRAANRIQDKIDEAHIHTRP